MRRPVLGFVIALVVFAGCVPAPMYQQAVQKSQLYEQLNQQLQAFYNVATPNNGPDWQLRFQVQLLFPK